VRYTFQPGKTYRATIQLSGLEMLLADVEDVAEKVKEETGLPVSVKQLRLGFFEATGTFTGEHPLRVDLPEEVKLVQEVPTP
jgi:hypothetical protein